MTQTKPSAAVLRSELDEPRLSIAPLIDVCFLLLIYFMVTCTIQPAERDLAKQVPGTPTESAKMASAKVVISVRADGTVLLNPGPYEMILSTNASERDLPKLEDHLEMLQVGAQSLPPVLIMAEGEAEHQRVVDVMNVLERTGWDQVAFLDDEAR